MTASVWDPGSALPPVFAVPNVEFWIPAATTLRSLPGILYKTVAVMGYNTEGDFGEDVVYWYDASDTTTPDNGGTVFKAADGSRWKLLHSGLVDIAKFGVDLSGTNDSTAAIQAALNDSTITQLYMRGSLKSTNLLVPAKSYFRMFGKSTITWFGTPAPTVKLGLQLNGDQINCEYQDMTFQCDGVLANGQSGIWSNSGFTFDRVKIHDNKVISGVNGISLNTNLAGASSNCDIYWNEIVDTVGTDSGQGYGIHHADNSGVYQNNRIFENRVYRATRHSIYQAQGIGVDVFENELVNHRSTVPDGTIRSAINCLRSSDITIHDNTIWESNDGGIYVARTANRGSDYHVYGNKFRKTAASNTVPCLMVGSQNPATNDPDSGTPEGAPTQVYLDSNRFNIDNNVADMIRVYCATSIDVTSNKGMRTGTSGSVQGILIYGVGGDTYNANHTYENNSFDQAGAGAAIRFQAALAGTTFNMRFIRNSAESGGQLFGPLFVGQVMDNPNIWIENQPVSGLPLAAGNYISGRYDTVYTRNWSPNVASGAMVSFIVNSAAYTKAGDTCIASLANSVAGIMLSAECLTDGQITVSLFNISGSPFAPGAQVLTVQSFHRD